MVMQLVPNEIPTGKEFNVIMQIENTGSSTWFPDDDLQLYSLTPAQIWGVSHQNLKKQIESGEIAKFKFKVTAPLVPGEHDFQWQMRHGKIKFGEPTSPIKIHVTGTSTPKNQAEFVFQKVPEAMQPGKTFTVMLQFKNTSSAVWTSGHFALMSLTPDAGLTWALDRVELEPKSVVRPGEFYTLRFDIRSPDKPGIYPFQWQMSHSKQGPFGSPSRPVSITVK